MIGVRILRPFYCGNGRTVKKDKDILVRISTLYEEKCSHILAGIKDEAVKEEMRRENFDRSIRVFEFAVRSFDKIDEK